MYIKKLYATIVLQKGDEMTVSDFKVVASYSIELKHRFLYDFRADINKFIRNNNAGIVAEAIKIPRQNLSAILSYQVNIDEYVK